MKKAFAPATVANVAVGFDILGFALKGLGETAWVQKIKNSNAVFIDPIAGFPQIPTDAKFNTATAGLIRLIKDKKLDFGFHVYLKKTIPVGSGLGGSATSAVATMVAANAYLKKKLNEDEILDYALTGEEVASGARHADNVAPCLFGGLVFCGKSLPAQFCKVKVPGQLRAVVLLPDLQINTKESRKNLNSQVPLPVVTEAMSNLAGFILGCQKNDLHLIKNSLKDILIEPQRAGQIPFFFELQKAALDAGALGCSISGSGPAIFALAPNLKTAQDIKNALLTISIQKKLSIKGSWVSAISSKGARLI